MSGALVDVRLQTRSIESGRQMDRLGEQNMRSTAAVAARLSGGEGVQSVRIDHHPSLARAEMLRIADEADRRWALRAIILIHRHGAMDANAVVQFIGVAADDMGDCQLACSWLAEQVKTRPPFWRQDLLADGATRWHAA